MMQARKWTMVAAVACVLARMAPGADVSPGYTFTAGELVTHTKLNTAGAGSINTSFFSSKSSAGSDPNTAWQLLLRDTGNDLFRRSTLAEAVFDHSSLLSARTAKTAPTAADLVLLYDAAAGTYKSLALSNLIAGAASTSALYGPSNKLVHMDTLTGALRTMTLGDMVTRLPAKLGPVDATDRYMLADLSGNLSRITAAGAITLAITSTVWGGSEAIAYENGGQVYNIRSSNMIAGASTVTALGTNDLFQVLQAASATVRQFNGLQLRGLAQSGYVLLRDEQSSGTSGGGVTNVWSIRRVNTVVSDGLGLVTSGPGSTNSWTLAAGTYRYRVVCPGLQLGVHQCMLTNISGGAIIGLGRNGRSGTGDNTGDTSEAVGRFTLAAPAVLGVRHRASTLNGTDGGGAATSWGTEIYTTVEFWRED